MANVRLSRAVSQLLWSQKVREEWFSLEENHEKAYRSGLHQLRNSSKALCAAVGKALPGSHATLNSLFLAAGGARTSSRRQPRIQMEGLAFPGGGFQNTR